MELELGLGSDNTFKVYSFAYTIGAWGLTVIFSLFRATKENM